MTAVQNPLETALSNPWGTLRTVLDEPLHPGGTAATEALLDRAAVTEGTRLLDIGCGAGEAVRLARQRDAEAIGLDRDPATPIAGVIRGDLTALPVRDGCVDVVLAECSICLAGELDRPLAESRRVLDDGGRLALSDVVVEGSLPELPEEVAQALCLTDFRSETQLKAHIEAAGFEVCDRQDHRDDLLAMRDRLADRVDYKGLLGLLGERGQRLLAAIEDLEAAAEDGRISYVSLVAK